MIHGGIVGGYYGLGSDGGLTEAEVDARVAAGLNLDFVDSLPDADDAEGDKIYVRTSDFSQWVRKGTTIAGFVTHAAFTGYFPGYTDRGVHASDSDVSSPVDDDIFFSTSRNSFRLYNGSNWVDRSVAQVTSTTHVGVGIGSGTPIPITVDTYAEVTSYFASNGFDTSNTYLIYIAGQPNIREATTYTAATTEYSMVPIDESPGGFYHKLRRTLVADADRDTGDEVVLDVHTGTIYRLKIDEEDFDEISRIRAGTPFAGSQGNVYWKGVVSDHEPPSSGTVHTIDIDMDVTEGTFSTGEAICLEFGALTENPVSYFVTTGLTTRQPRTLRATDVVNANWVLSFEPTPFQTENGGVGTTLEDIQDETNADARTNTEGDVVDASNSVFPFDPGTYHVGFEFYGNQPPDTDLHLAFLHIMSGTDDIEEFSGTTRQQQFFADPAGSVSESDIDSVFRVEEKDLKVTVASKFYLQLRNEGHDTNRLAGYIRIEKVK